MKRRLIFTCCIFLASLSWAQMSEIGVFGGVSYYAGDMNPLLPYPYKMTRPSFGLLYRYYLNSRLAFAGSYTRGTIVGSDQLSKFIPERNYSFTSKFNELAVRFEYHFLSYLTGSTRNYYSTFIFGGIGVTNYNPIVNEGISQFAFINEDRVYKGALAPVFPFGIGFKYSIGKKFGLTVEWSMRKTFTDNLDGLSATYSNLLPVPEDPFSLIQDDLDEINQNNIREDPGGVWHVFFKDNDPGLPGQDPDTREVYFPRYNNGDQKSNAITNDWYSFLGATLTYKFSLVSKKKCHNAEYGRKYLIK